jgi:hypothetical protein
VITDWITDLLTALVGRFLVVLGAIGLVEHLATRRQP